MERLPEVTSAPSTVVINPQVKHTSTRRPLHHPFKTHHEYDPFKRDNHLYQHNIQQHPKTSPSLNRHKMNSQSTHNKHRGSTTGKPSIKNLEGEMHQMNNNFIGGQPTQKQQPNINQQQPQLQFHVVLSTTRPPLPGINGDNRQLPAPGNPGNDDDNFLSDDPLSRVKRRGARGGGFGNQGRKGPRDRLDYRRSLAVYASLSSVLQVIVMLLPPIFLYFTQYSLLL